ncbi:hypothetical protein SLEP1_g38381 [Rubroshorea leprosula]|nr:hypothetical protein SLEP1_g38381 [Rubroshorea leprosula]
MADLILGPIVDATVSKVTALASEQLNLALGWRKDLERFRNIMNMLGGVLQDADERHVAGDTNLKAWLERLRDVADEADDVFEEIRYENLRRQVAELKPMWKKVSYFFTLSNPLVFRMRMANRVKKLNAYLDDINDSANRFGLQNKLANTSAPQPRLNQQTHSFLEQEVVGRNEDVDQIVSLLIDSCNQEALSVISIVGMAGLGKTTLAKKVCANDKIREYFGEKIMWVCVSEIFDVQRILGEMLESLTGSPCINRNRDTLLRKIGEELEKKEGKKEGGKEEKREEKNYLLILDDVWSEESGNWVVLRSCLLGICRKAGNRVVVTTRSRNVASIMGSKYIHVLGQLELDQCWFIIKQRAFGGDAVPPKLEEIGFGIAEKCGGVPLVANVIGGTLYNRRDEDEWLSVKEKINVWGSLEDQHRQIMDVLQLSFERLPKPALKQCFAFCSIFPKDFVIPKEKLIQLWMAVGFLQSSKESSMEEMGDKYFNCLLSYSLFQWEASAFEDACKIHDLFHDFVQSIYDESVIIEERSSCNISHQARHLNLSFGKEKVHIKLEDVAEKLQTLFSEQGFPTSLKGNFKRLRALGVSGADDGEPIPSCFGNLKSLRYLDISGTPIRQLPKFITKMYNLQTFRFNNCRSLKMPPEGIGHLMNLRHIYFDDEDRMPAHIGRLTSLQTLQKFFVGEKRGRKVEELGKLSQLRGALQIYNLECVKDQSEAQRARLKEKAVLMLQLIWDEEGNCNKDEDVLEGLQPPSNLKTLRIQGYGGENLPSWMLESHSELFLLKNLVGLDFEKCQKLKGIPLLKGFSSLRRLHIRKCSELSRINDGGHGAFEFTSLEELSISDCHKLESVLVNGLTSLERLFLFNCHKLESVLVNGLTSLQTLKIVQCELVSSIGDSLSTSKRLKELLLFSCENLESVPSVEGLTSLKRVEIVQCYRLKYLPSGLSSCTALEELHICNCRNLVSILEELKELPSLVELEISGCEKLRSFPKDSLGCLNRLKSLSIGRFSKEMEEFPDLSSINASLEMLDLRHWRTHQWLHQIQRFTALKELSITGPIDDVEALSDVLEKLSSLTKLRISCCHDLISLPQGLNKLPHLRTLEIFSCNNLTSLSEDLKELRSLITLHVSHCRRLNPGEILGCLTSLKRLEIGGFSEELEEFPGLSSIHDGLEELRLIGWDKLNQLPHQIQHLTTLKELTIESFKQVVALPEWVGNFSSLQYLLISTASTTKPFDLGDLTIEASKIRIIQRIIGDSQSFLRHLESKLICLS